MFEKNLQSKIEKENKVKNPATVIFLLSASVGLMMTGYGIVMPVMAKRLGELGAGVETLGFMSMAFAIGQFFLSPFMGSYADRFGRRPLILVALLGGAIANILFLLVASSEAYIGLRFFQGAVGAGLLPASMSMVGDIFPENKRAQWTGILMGSYGIGFIFGPTVGGVLYDGMGFVAPFAVSAVLNLLALAFALVLVPETRPASVRKTSDARKAEGKTRGKTGGALPRPLYILFTLLALDFISIFGFAFIEPAMAFFFYDDLKFSTTEFGMIAGAYGLAMVVGQTTLGRLSDKLGRTPVIALGFILSSSLYISLILFRDFVPMTIGAMVAGLAVSLTAPALSAFYLDITAEEYRARIMGMKESAAALAGIAGPLLVALVSGWVNSQGIFAIAGVIMVLAGVLALVALRQNPRETAGTLPAEAALAEELVA